MNVVCRFLFALVLSLGACGATDTIRVPDARPSSVLPDMAAPASTLTDAAALAPGHNAFGFDLWGGLAATHPGNLAISPTSLAVALGMVEAGATGDTRAALRSVLHLSLPDARVHALTGALISAWEKATPYTLAVANRLFGEATTPFEAPFLDVMANAYKAPLEAVDFIHGADGARTHINDWVEGATRKKIADLLAPGALDTDTRLVLVNAICFKGRWASRFDPAMTSTTAFHAPGTTVQVPTMSQSGTFGYGKSDGVTLLEMPYVGDDLAMLVVLPDAATTDALEHTLSAATLKRWTDALHPQEDVTVHLPRFKIATDSLPLKGPLVDLGLGVAFGADAHFEAMTTADRLHIDDAFHKVFVEVNEDGTEAAAATAVVMSRGSARMPTRFIADHPFLFFIRDTRTGDVLFMGRVTNPNA